jgi:peptide-methionine (S)-S-oxide reductase
MSDARQTAIGLLALCLCNALPGISQAERAIFAGGCFWCMESDFQEIAGVTAVISGYTGGHTPNPDYKSVSSGGTGHYEAVEVEFDSARISYRQLLDIYWVNIDPLDGQGQFCDRGSSYRTALFPIDAAQRATAEATRDSVQASLGPQKIATVIVDAATFYPAEDYHQDYYLKNPLRYKYYRWSCGRDRRLAELWGSG